MIRQRLAARTSVPSVDSVILCVIRFERSQRRKPDAMAYAINNAKDQRFDPDRRVYVAIPPRV